MVLRLPGGYVFDPADPRAPAVDAWERMLPEERDRVVAMLPADVPLERPKLRFFAGNAALDDADEMIARLGSMLDKEIANQEALATKLAEEQLLREEADRLREEAERRLAEALAEIERLKKGG